MTAEERVRVRMAHYVRLGADGDRFFDVQDVLDLFSTLDALRKSYEERGRVIAVLTKGAKPSCVWTEDEDGNWSAGCGHVFDLYMGTPAENGIAFCPYCGAALREA